MVPAHTAGGHPKRPVMNPELTSRLSGESGGPLGETEQIWMGIREKDWLSAKKTADQLKKEI